MSVKVSVILPIYNVAPYLKEAFDSILSQSLREIEIIAVNDGSTDNSLDIIKKYATVDNRIVIYSQENQGQSVARNLALQHATGEYIYMMDSDDMLNSPDVLLMCYEYARCNNADFVFFDRERFMGENVSLSSNIHSTRFAEENKRYDGESLLNLLLDTSTYNSVVWLLLINHQYLQRIGLKFYPGIIHEDELFTTILMLNSKSIFCLKQSLVNHRMHPSSTVGRRFSRRNIDCYLTVADELLCFSQKPIIHKFLRYTLSKVFYFGHTIPYKDKAPVFWRALKSGYLKYIGLRSSLKFFTCQYSNCCRIQLSYKFRMRAKSFLHPIRSLKALYFIHFIQPSDKWKEIVETDRKKAFEMKWNRFYREPFPWKNPRTSNEKLTWLAAMTDTSKWTKYSDKYEVRKYIESLGLKDILTECYGVWDHAEDIDFVNLPNKFVLKCTHDCGSTVLVPDKTKMNKKTVIDFLNSHLAVRYGYASCEPHYIPIKPRVMAESLIEIGDSGEFSSTDTIDYKIRCIEGKAKYALVCYGRGMESEGASTHQSVVDLYDIYSWQPMRQYLTDVGATYRDVPRPENLEKMIEIAERIGQGFLQVRVDLYNVKGKIYFGEMTFFAASGMNYSCTKEFHRIVGDMIRLPEV